MILLLVFVLLIIALIYVFLKRKLSYWEKRDVPFPKYNLLFGNIFDSLIVKKSIGQIYTDIYENFKEYRYVGFYKLQSPGIVLRDPELVKNVMVKNFDNFSSNGMHIEESTDPLAARNAFMLEGAKWKLTRSQLTRCFTGGKMKTIAPLLEQTGKNMATYIQKEIDNVGEATLDTKVLLAKYTIDNVATCAFGVNGDAFVNPDSEFIKHGTKIFEVTTLNALKILTLFLFPPLASVLKISFIPKDVCKYLINIVDSTLKFRKENGVVRKDFLHYMEEIKNTPGDYEFKNIDIVAQCAGFFLDGFETSSITMTFAMYCIAKHPDIQNKLKEEIDTVLEKYNGEITYDAVKEMTYLDCVFCESQRLFPVGMMLSKICTKDFEFPSPRYNDNGKGITVEKGTTVVIPLYALQHDEKYFDDVETFNPDRFSEENKNMIDKGTYLPFGVGPRMCLGQTFAILQTKIGLISIIKNFEVRVSKKTQEPIVMDPKNFMLTAIGGIWLNYYKRQNDSK